MWVFIEVPAAEVELAKVAGAELHRKTGKWFFDDAKFSASDFARWKRIPTPDGAGKTPAKKAVEPDSQGLSLHEVSGLTGHSNKVIRALIEDGRFPRPVSSTGISARSDRWSLEQIKEWIELNGFGALARGGLDEQRQRLREDGAGAQTLYTMSEIAREAGIAPLSRAFVHLRSDGVLIEHDDEALNNRPTDEYMKRGWFGRLERYLPNKQQTIYQTVVTAAGREPVVALLKDKVKGS